jgi:hypothetical protein
MIFVYCVPVYLDIDISRWNKGRQETRRYEQNVPLLQLNLPPICPRLRSDELLEIADCIFRTAFHSD